MTLQIYKSQIDAIPFDYAEQVEAHRQALLAHRFTGDAAPTAPALVEQAVRRVQNEGYADDFIADFAIIDDTPPPAPEPTDDERKAALVAKVRHAEIGATSAVIPPGKQRLLNLEASIAFGKPDMARSEQEQLTLKEHFDVQSAISAVQLHFAKLEAEIDDLSPEQYETWTPTPFPTA